MNTLQLILLFVQVVHMDQNFFNSVYRTRCLAKVLNGKHLHMILQLSVQLKTTGPFIQRLHSS